VFELHLAKCAARAFVAEQFLQAHHIGGQAVDLLLRFVNRRQARHYAGEGLVRFLETFFESFVDLAGNFRQATVGRFGKFGHSLSELLRCADQRQIDLFHFAL